MQSRSISSNDIIEQGERELKYTIDSHVLEHLYSSKIGDTKTLKKSKLLAVYGISGHFESVHFKNYPRSASIELGVRR